MSNWRDYGTIRKNDVFKAMTEPLGLPGFKADVGSALHHMLTENDPPIVRATLDRLLGLDRPEEHARWLISCVIAAEIIATAEAGPTDDWDRLASRLATLPETPWIVDDN